MAAVTSADGGQVSACGNASRCVGQLILDETGKDRITIQDLMTHVSGLRADVDLADPWTGREAAIRLAAEEVPAAAPGQRFSYSDINFFLLGHIVGRVSGEPLERYTARHVFTIITKINRLPQISTRAKFDTPIKFSPDSARKSPISGIAN